ncbi:hypothetical protein B1H18_01115 [Streptomyces tsukubensis]|uniref:FAD/NAD(P)-binding oxidoreductase n=2 Tax=Streptomyces tsukubensis TaxID=83656 RepID=A0A1V4AH54_9ACTN|nr:hypothetical protein B1H18_01115 [Streptomyces tsukubensis]
MAAARLVEEIGRRDPEGRRTALTVLGAEHVPAYNRVLLPALCAGTLREDDLALGPAGGPPPGADVRLGTEAVLIDRGRRVVTTHDGDQVAYDQAVLATGATAVRPGVTGLDGPGVTVLRTLGDARRLGVLARAARRRGLPIAVLGGGVLGLETARALAAGGLIVTVVHPAAHLMNRQLDTGAGRILADALRRTGVRLRLGSAVVRWDGAGPPHERRLHLADGTVHPCAGLVLATGSRPRTRLARECGLAADEYGVRVDDTLTTSDPAIRALGDCAHHPGAPGGLVQPAWDQAAVLAGLLTATDPGTRYRGTAAVTRLKATGIDLTCLGEARREPGDADDTAHEVIRLEDPARERYAKLVLRGDTVTGAIMLGVPDAAAGLVQLYTRGAPAPADRLALLLGRALPPEAAGGGPAALPDYAVVCRCNTVTKSALRGAWHAGAKSPAELIRATRATTGCGGCRADVEKTAAWLAETDPAPGVAVPDLDHEREGAVQP